MTVQGDKSIKPGVKIFTTNWLYITFISSHSFTMDVRPQFIDQQKASSMKYVVSSDTKKFDNSATGVDAPTIPS